MRFMYQPLLNRLKFKQTHDPERSATDTLYFKHFKGILTCVFVGFLYQLVVHVGVSGMATTVTLEKCGRNHGYKGLDNSSFCPDSQCCVVGGPDCIDSVIDMESVCKRVAASGLGVAVSVSKDAGR